MLWALCEQGRGACISWVQRKVKGFAAMRCDRSVMSTRYITLLLWLCVSLLAPAIVAAQNDNANGANGNSALAFWNSLTPAERKLPRDILVAQRLAAGKTVPPGWERSAEASSKNRSSQVSERLYRLDGDSLAALESVLWEIGAEAISKSRSRAYLTTKLMCASSIGR